MTELNSKVKPDLSIVIASQNARQSVNECLSVLESQRNGRKIEIIVVDNSTDGTTEIITAKFSGIKLVKSEKEKLIPELWGIGIKHSTGNYIAVTTTHFIPSSNWISEILRAQNSDYAGIGGAIENADSSDIVSWAVYFCRYSRYMLPFSQKNVDDFAADNASYKRTSLAEIDQSLEGGFWEVFVHKEMVIKKMQLILRPEIIVYHQKSFTFFDFMAQRFWHGRQFGKTRIAEIPFLNRVFFLLGSPLIPFIYLYRISKRVFSKQRNIGKYLLSLPILFLFLIAWSVGELSGYLWKSE